MVEKKKLYEENIQKWISVKDRKYEKIKKFIQNVTSVGEIHYSELYLCLLTSVTVTNSYNMKMLLSH